jgi:hypothetical protein
VDFGQEFAKLVTLTAARTLLGTQSWLLRSQLCPFLFPGLMNDKLGRASVTPAQAVRSVSTCLRRLPT